MSDFVNAAGGERGTEVPTLTWRERWQRMRGAALFAGAALVVIWMLLPLLPVAWGVRFGTPYLTFFSLAVLGAAGFFMLLNWGPIRPPRSGNQSSAFTTTNPIQKTNATSMKNSSAVTAAMIDEWPSVAVYQYGVTSLTAP